VIIITRLSILGCAMQYGFWISSDMLAGRYGIDNIKVSIVIFLFMCAITFYQIQNKPEEVKQDWPKYRCRPDVMPFSGWINAPDGVSPKAIRHHSAIRCVVLMFCCVAPLTFPSDFLFLQQMDPVAHGRL
jgi:hypothetical protein